MPGNKNQYYQNSVVVVGATPISLATALVLAKNRFSVTILVRNTEAIEALKRNRTDFHESALDMELNAALREGRLSLAASSKKHLQTGALIILAGEPSESGTSKLRLSTFERLAGWIGEWERDIPAVVVIRAAMPLGFTSMFRRLLADTPHGDKVRIVVSPDFARPGSTYEDTSRPKAVYVGAEDGFSGSLVANIFRKVYPKSVKIVRTSSEAAELIGLAPSLYIAQKHSITDEIAEYARTKGLDFAAIKSAMENDPRIDGELPAPGLGFAGPQLLNHCRALKSREAGNRFTFETAKTALYVNDLIIDGLIYRLRKRIGRLTGYKIAVFGITAFPGSADCRGSRAVVLARDLRQRGAEVALFDPMLKGRDKVEPGNLPLQSDEESAVKGASALVIGTPHRRFGALKPAELAKLMKEPLIMDYFRFLKRHRWETAGFTFIDRG